MSEQTATTEDTILAGIEAAEEGVEQIPYGSEPTDAEIADIEGTPTPQATGEDASQQPKPGEADQTQQQQPTDPSGKPKTDKDGNLVTDTGDLIARRGAERRVFEQAQRLRDENQRITDIAKKQAETIDQMNILNGRPAQLGLSNDDVDLALRVIHQFKSSPVEAARYVVAEAMRAGHNLKDIIGNDEHGASTLDMRAVGNLIDDRLKPVLDDRAVRQEEAARIGAEQEVEREYHTFLDTHQHAEIHQDAIARLMASKNIDAPSAYWQVRSWAAENGLDFTQPLAPQITARQNPPQGGGNPPANAENTGAPPAPRPMPRSASSASPITVPNDQHVRDAGMSSDADFDDIVQQAMRESGM